MPEHPTSPFNYSGLVSMRLNDNEAIDKFANLGRFPFFALIFLMTLMKIPEDTLDEGITKDHFDTMHTPHNIQHIDCYYISTALRD